MTTLVYHPPPGSPSGESGSSPVEARAIAIPMPAVAPVELSLERWARWGAKGRKNDRIMRRRFQIIGGIVLVCLMGWLLWTL